MSLCRCCAQDILLFMSVKLTAWSKVVVFKEDTVAQVFQKDTSLSRSKEWSMFEETILPGSVADNQ